MTRKQKKAWRRLSPAKRRQYIRRAEKEAGHDHVRQGIALKKKASALPVREMTADPETARQLAGWKPGREGYGKALPALRRLRLRKEKEQRLREQRMTGRSTSSGGSSGMGTPDQALNGATMGDGVSARVIPF